MTQLGPISNLPAIPGNEDPKPLTPQQMSDWNKYVDYVAKRGYRNSPLLDKKDTKLAWQLMDDFKKEHPNASISMDDIKSVQMEMQKLKNQSQAFAERKGDPNAKNIMSNVSAVDGWPGSKTTQFRFPDLISENYHNNNLTSSQNLGLVNGMFQPTGNPGGGQGAGQASPNSKLATANPIPQGAKTMKDNKGVLHYFNEKTGYWVPVN